jgi:UDP-glucose 4-epimerase
MAADKKRLIVTGGAGFIGSHIARRLLTMGHKVWVIDNLATGSEANIPARAEFIRADISREASYKKMPRGKIDAVFHLAAQSSGEISDERPSLDLKWNALGTLLLLNWCRENGTSRFLHASSMGVYGQAKTLPVSEEHPCQPISPYGISKLTAEKYIGLFSGKGMKTTVFRIFSAYGPGQDMLNLKQGMVSIFMYYLLKKEPVLVKGPPDRFRDFLFIDDIVDAWVGAADNKRAFGKTYNLAYGKKTTVRDLIREEIKAFRYDPATYPVVSGKATPNDQSGLYADITKIKQELGWSPKISLSQGLSIMVKWVKENAKV